MTGEILSCILSDSPELPAAVWDPSWPQPPRYPDEIPVAAGGARQPVTEEVGWSSVIRLVIPRLASATEENKG